MCDGGGKEKYKMFLQLFAWVVFAGIVYSTYKKNVLALVLLTSWTVNGGYAECHSEVFESAPKTYLHRCQEMNSYNCSYRVIIMNCMHKYYY